jgi:(E)-4-hydroxy-3-methylbut-2-enyl-diphosphate synthase
MPDAIVNSRRKTRRMSIGGVPVGGGAPISVQSMTNTKTSDVDATVAQIRRLEDAGCEIVRLAVPDDASVQALGKIRKKVEVPLVADIHFRHDYAIAAIEAGFDAIRINPGNIGTRDKVEAVVRAAKARNLPMRIGVNAGSLEKDILKRFRHPSPEALTESALRHVKIFEELGFHDIKISAKASSVLSTIATYRLLSERVDYPLHVGVTEAGTLLSGAIKSAMGIGMLLKEGIGDTIRVSLTADVAEEVKAGYEILSNLGLRERPYPEIISCPTCGRLGIDLMKLVGRVEAKIGNLKLPIKVAVMGCVVNGPGEAREADVGVAGGDGRGVIIRAGEVVRTCDEAAIEEELMREIRSIASERGIKINL